MLNLVTTSPEETAELVGLVTHGGVLVSTTTPAAADAARGVSTSKDFVRSDSDQLAEVVSLVDAGALHVHIAERVRPAELPAAHARSDAGTPHGKRVIAP